MPRPFKPNEVPVANFNLRTEGPLTLLAATSMVHGKLFRAATGSDPDKRATVDKGPCPHCGAQVEWVYTVKDNTKYVYARCRGIHHHKWGFRGRADNNFPKPRASMGAWIDAQIQALQSELKKMMQLREIAHKMPVPMPSP